MKPTVSLRSASRPEGSMTRLKVGSRVAKSLHEGASRVGQRQAQATSSGDCSMPLQICPAGLFELQCACFPCCKQEETGRIMWR